MCDPRDLNQTLGDGEQEHPDGTSTPGGRESRRIAEESGVDARVGTLDPTLFLFDAQPGGVGLAERIYEIAPDLMGRAQTLVERCPCATGCPACVGPSESGPRKELALQLIDALQFAQVHTLN